MRPRRSAVRVVVVTATLLAGCAALADLRDPEPDDPAVAARPDGSTGAAADSAPASTASPDASVPDAYTGDGATTTKPPDPTPVTCANPGKAPNGDSCGEPSQCCSGACTQTKVCDTRCFKVGEGSCDPGKTGDCCIRAYCSYVFNLLPPNFRCKACLESGVPPETVKNILTQQTIPVKESCCRGQLDSNGNCL